jgi:hypothetical protein
MHHHLQRGKGSPEQDGMPRKRQYIGHDLPKPEAGYRGSQDPLRQILRHGNKPWPGQQLEEVLPCAEHTGEQGLFQQGLVCRNLRIVKPALLSTLA